jgi:hypothetical protein
MGIWTKRRVAAKEAGMKWFAGWTLALALTGILAVPQPAQAFDEQIILSSAFQQALGILTCKDPTKYSFVGIREGVYVFNSHYAKGFVEFYVQINGDMAIFTSRAWHGRMPSGRIMHDYPAGCVTVNVDPLPCSKTKIARACGSP